MIPKYELIRSHRKSLSLEIGRDLTVTVRAPIGCSQREIDRFVSSREKWLEEHMDIQRQRAIAHPEPDDRQREKYISLAKTLLPARVEYYSSLMGLSPTGMRVTGAKTRFGSCSAKNRLCFSWRLMAFPPEAVDYVVVHELAHIVHKNHGSRFYALIASVMPDHKERRKLLNK